MGKPTELFTIDNTEWQDEEDDFGNHSQHLVYTGDMQELAKETGLTEEQLQDELLEYERTSRDFIDEEREIAYASTGR